MYRIARIRCAGVGPIDARYDRPAPDAAPFEVSCLGADGSPTDSLVWLENGGGKTVLLALMFHVLRPDKAAQIGKDQSGRSGEFSDYLLGDDIAHVVIEWVADDSDDRLFTGIVGERRGATPHRTWYLLTVRTPDVTLDSLVFEVDGRRVTSSRYIDSLQALATQAGKSGRRGNLVDLVKTTTQRIWIETLADHNLDPKLFEYQVRMNRAEGAAPGLFRFDSPERFVEFFLDLTLNSEMVVNVSETVRRVTEKVAALPGKELELAHATEAVERLGSLADSWHEHGDARQAEVNARKALWRLYDMLASAEEAQQRSIGDLTEAARLTNDRYQDADKARREADNSARGLAVVAADARVSTTSHLENVRREDLNDAQLSADAWRRVPDRLEVNRLEGVATGLRAALQKAEAAAAPLRDVRDSTLRTLRAALETLRDQAVSEAATALEEKKSANDMVEADDAALKDAVSEIARIEERTATLAKQINAYDDQLGQAMERGLLGANETPADATALCDDEANAAQSERQACQDEAGGLETELVGLGKATEATSALADEAKKTAEKAEATVSAGERERAELAAHPLLAELGADRPDLDLVGTELAMRAGTEAARQRALSIRIAAEVADDQRAVDALARNNLLPPRKEVERLCAELRAAGIAYASPGWLHIVETVAAGRHEALIAAQPGLLDGIIVAESDIERAEELLANGQPAGAIVVGSAGALTESDRSDLIFVVPPAEAMYRRSAAEDELTRRQGLLEEAARAADAAQSAEQTARALAERLLAHFERWPAGLLPRERAVANSLQVDATNASESARAAKEAEASARSALSACTKREKESTGRIERATRRIARLAPLVEKERVAEEARAGLEACAAETTTANTALERATRNLKRAKVTLAEVTTTHEGKVASHRKLVERLGDLPDPGAGPSAQAAPLDELQAAYETADEILTNATTRSDAMLQLQRHEKELSELKAELDLLDEALRQRVETLAASTEASDVGTRQGALKAANEAVGSAVGELSAAQVAHELAVAKRAALPPPERPLDTSGLPTDPDRLEALAAAAVQAFEQARDARSRAEEALNTAVDKRDAAQLSLDRLRTQRSPLAVFVGDHVTEPAPAFEGDAQEAVNATVAELERSRKAAIDTDAAWHEAARKVNVFAHGERWVTLSGDLPRRLRDNSPDDLARDARHLATQTEILAKMLAKDIADLDTHRQLLVTSLGDAVAEAVRSLNRAQTKSRLPDGLGDWSGQPFLKVTLAVPAGNEMDARLRRFVADLIERVPASGYPTGAVLICRALWACAEREPKIEVLKPHRAYRLQYVPVHDLAPLSGGMRATAAIAMFCTLARVRATNQTGRFGVGTLILDNPLGDASATFLVRLQMLMARLSDVQLLFTTGVNDMDAIRLFPVVTRLTNESAKRSHLSYVIADEAFLKRLMASESDYSLVTGSRLVRNRPLDLVVVADEEPGE